ncbi:hypothetical protein Pla52o_06700 [Novipirellula galeiformis]|uniref:Uncharacterized protein n=1 Tax=Novipirellula galeiformis TaxID=2528004 RepID=A0A5C6CSF9_9BACT|nr:hypothetical protein Pla52o_06700 [Novipirellula galeiformis]
MARGVGLGVRLEGRRGRGKWFDRIANRRWSAPPPAANDGKCRSIQPKSILEMGVGTGPATDLRMP